MKGEAEGWAEGKPYATNGSLFVWQLITPHPPPHIPSSPNRWVFRACVGDPTAVTHKKITRLGCVTLSPLGCSEMPRLFIHKLEERYAPDSTVNNRAVQLYLFLATASIFLLTLLSVLPKRSPFLWLSGSISMRGYSWCDFFFYRVYQESEATVVTSVHTQSNRQADVGWTTGVFVGQKRNFSTVCQHTGDSGILIIHVKWTAMHCDIVFLINASVASGSFIQAGVVRLPAGVWVNEGTGLYCTDTFKWNLSRANPEWNWTGCAGRAANSIVASQCTPAELKDNDSIHTAAVCVEYRCNEKGSICVY